MTARKRNESLNEDFNINYAGKKLRQAVDRIREAQLGALNTIIRQKDIKILWRVGFRWNRFTPQKVYELSKMDSGIISPWL